MISWEMLLWLSGFVVVAGLLGIVMYTLICLSDLENDFINPHDSAARINKFVVPEFAGHAGLTVLLLFTGHWIMFLLNLPLLVYHARHYSRNTHLMDVTEIFKDLEAEKRLRLIKLGFYLSLFIVVIFRLVETGVGLLMEEHGPTIEKKVFGNMAE